MAAAETDLQLHLSQSFHDITPKAWDDLRLKADPFTSHRFMMALEASGSVGEDSGWLPAPLLLKRGDTLCAALPLWVKTHSQGEYIFDHGWAEAYARAGGGYYPKLQAAVPFTPVTGARFLGGRDHRQALALGAANVAAQNGLSSLHITFCLAEEAQDLDGFEGFMARESLQFHWHNHGYADFEAFLDALSSRKRKAIRRERAEVAASGLRIERLQGKAIEPAHWDAFWTFYQDTGARKWGQPYLTRAAFDMFGAAMADEILLVMAFDDERPVAAALNFIGSDALYGRWWGTTGDFPFLHFELCYYQAIDFAIAQGLARVEAGAQGEHKVARGYVPVRCYSLHWFRDAGFARAVAHFLKDERRHIAEAIAHYMAQSPYRQGE